MTPLASNLNCLEQTWPALAKTVKAHLSHQPLQPLPLDSLGRPNLLLKTPSGNTWLYSPTLPEDLHQMQQQLLSVYNPQVMVWMGLGLGHHLKAYLEKPHRLNEFQILIEPSLETFCHFLNQADWSRWLTNKRFFWLVGLPAEQLEQSFHDLTTTTGFTTASINHLVVEWMPPNPYFETAARMWKDFSETTFLLDYNSPIDGYYGFMNVMQNFKNMQGAPVLQGLKGTCAGKPGIVVSTGPSLTHSMEILRQIKDRAVIFSVDSSLRLLMEQGIVPTFTGCLERMESTRRHFEGVDTSQTMLITTPCLHPKTLHLYQGPKTFFVRSENFLPWFYPDIPIDKAVMSSVSHLALYSLWHMGCSPIILLGQDLAFDPKTNTSHARGALWTTGQDEVEKMGTEISIQLPANQGGEVVTNQGWRQFAKIFTLLIRNFGIDCYNAIPKGHGMEIDGTRWMDPQELPLLLKEAIRTDGILESCKKTKNILNKNPEHTREIVKQTERALEDLIEKCHHIIWSIHDFFLNNPPELIRSQTIMNYENFFKKIQAETEAHNQIPILNEFVSRVTAGVHNHLLRKSFTLMAETDNSPELLRTKLTIPLDWYQEILGKAKLMLRQIQKLAR